MNDKTQIAKDILCARMRAGMITTDHDVRRCCAWAKLILEECTDSTSEKPEERLDTI